MAETARRLEDRFQRGEREETGKIGRMVETQARRIPISGFLGLAVGSMVLSAGLEFLGRTESTRQYGTFVGLWAPSFLLMGIYTRMKEMREEGIRRET